jgi:hypothetical protein
VGDFLCFRGNAVRGNEINEDEMSGTCDRFGEEINSCRVVVGQHDRMRPLGRTRLRWANIEMDLNKIG